MRRSIDLQRLRDLPIEWVAERLGLAVVRHKCLCCFHPDHHPSLTFSVARNTYRCYSCGAHGGVIDLAMHFCGGDFKRACEWLDPSLAYEWGGGNGAGNGVMANGWAAGNMAPPPRPVAEAPLPFDASRYARYFEHPWLSPQAQQFLYGERRLSPAVVRYCRLNTYRDWLQIPYYDQQGQLVGVQRRYMGQDPSEPRFRFGRGARCHLYNQQLLPSLQPGEPLYVGEGPSDVWALLSAGKKAIGIPSATLLKPDDLVPLAQQHPRLSLHIYPDQDDAGEGLYHKLLDVANELGLCVVHHQLPRGCKDFADLWRSAEYQTIATKE